MFPGLGGNRRPGARRRLSAESRAGRAGVAGGVGSQRAWLRALPVERGRWRIRADLDRTDPVFLKRLVAVEDERFYLHPGVDPVSLVRAAAVAALTGHIRSGASTLTMQTARLLEPRRRTFAAKLIEMLRALQLERGFPSVSCSAST